MDENKGASPVPEAVLTFVKKAQDGQFTTVSESDIAITRINHYRENKSNYCGYYYGIR